MPQHVYKPPRGRYSIGVAIIGGLVCTGLLFLAIPLSQKLADFMAPPEAPVVEIEELAPPEEFVEETPPEEVEEEEPPEDLVEDSPDLDLGLEVAELPTGTGGGFQLSISNFKIADDEGAIGGALDQPPKPVSKAQANYPRSLLKKKVSGRVQIACKVSAKGTVAKASVHKSSGQSALDQAALKAAKRWKFKPAIVGGRPSIGNVIIPFNFQIKN